ncbi:peptide ABC transporter permease [Camelimonas abortus]|uniref:Peptide ABC transporter permease n=1 Tax=Camelimonas abortus TaxID=1017184 RepID=A0ABV7LBU8_9HYPH
MLKGAGVAAGQGARSGQEPGRSPAGGGFDPTVDTARLLRRVGFFVLVFLLPIGAVVSRRASVILTPVAVALLALASLIDRAPRSPATFLRNVFGSAGGVAALVLVGWAVLSIAWTQFPATAAEKVLQIGWMTFIGLAGVAAMPERVRTANLHLIPVGVAIGALGAIALGAFRAQDVNAELMDADPLDRGLVVLAVMVWPAVAWLACRGRVLGACVLLAVVAVATCVMPENAALLAVAVGAGLYALVRLTGDRGVRLAAIVMPALLAFAPLFPLVPRPFLKFFHGPMYPGAVALRAWAEETGREPLRMLTGHGLDTSIRSRLAGFLSPDAPRTLPFEIWYELGVVGALSAAAALYFAIMTARRQENPSLAAGIVACFGAAFAIASFGDANAQSWWLATLAAAIITFMAIRRGAFRAARPLAIGPLRRPPPRAGG